LANVPSQWVQRRTLPKAPETNSSSGVVSFWWEKKIDIDQPTNQQTNQPNRQNRQTRENKQAHESLYASEEASQTARFSRLANVPQKHVRELDTKTRLDTRKPLRNTTSRNK